MRAPRVTLDPDATVDILLEVVLQRLRAWSRHAAAPLKPGHDAAAIWTRLKEVEAKHEAVCGQLQRARLQVEELTGGATSCTMDVLACVDYAYLPSTLGNIDNCACPLACLRVFEHARPATCGNQLHSHALPCTCSAF
jgi:hypothetical protein